MAENNTNNNPVGGRQGTYSSNPISLIYRLVVTTIHFFLKFYITCILLAYEWMIKIAQGAIRPLEPVLAEVRKVPKKDISVEGIFYQILRLQFMVLLYVFPWVFGAIRYMAQPVVWLKGRMEAYVEVGDAAWRKADLKDG